MKLTLGGYYDASSAGASKMTHLVGDGGGRPETLSINGSAVPQSTRSQVRWARPGIITIDNLPAGTVSDAGVTTGVTFPSNSIDCLSWAGGSFRTRCAGFRR